MDAALLGMGCSILDVGLQMYFYGPIFVVGDASSASAMVLARASVGPAQGYRFPVRTNNLSTFDIHLH